MSATISSEVFRKRLIVLCVRAGDAGLPRKQQDRRILFMAVAKTLDPDRIYTEMEINEALIAWLETTGRRIATDYATMRRALVDDHFLIRDPAGNAYRIATDIEQSFAPDVAALDPATIVADARAEREARKRAHSEDMN